MGGEDEVGGCNNNSDVDDEDEDDEDPLGKLATRRNAIQSTLPDGKSTSHPFFCELVAEEKQTFRSVSQSVGG